MPVSVQTPVISYTANGSATVFTYPFRILAASDLQVYKDGALQSTGFTVSGVGVEGGGNVTFTVPSRPAAGVIVRLERKTPLTRVTDYVEGGALRAQVLDDDIDRVVMMVQDLDAALPVSGTAIEAVTYEGRKVFDTTSDTNPWPFTIQHSNVFTNSPTPYGSGSVLIEATGVNNNQPLLMLRKNIATTTFGNGANLILWNTGGPALAAGTRFSVDLEFVANNSAINNYNGKFELGGSSGVTGGSAQAEGGYFYIASRRGPLAPEGQNTGFERFLNVYNLDYGGEIEHLGNGMTITPKYTNSQAYLTITNAFAASRISAISTVSNAEAFFTAGGSGSNASINITSGSGTASSAVNFNDGADANKGWRIQYATSNSRLNFQPKVSGSYSNASYFDYSSDGMLTIVRTATPTRGRICLSNRAGAVGGGIVEYDSDTGLYTATGARMTINSVQVQVATNSTTGSRPTATATGQSHFDTTLQKPIWWNGTVWKDATGATV